MGVVFFLVQAAIGFGQDTSRYNSSYFKDVVVEKDVIYGNAATQGGVSQNLTMDIYQPKGDLSGSRPLIILAHGGFFLFGEKEEFATECEYFAQAGYVAVSINYRLIDIEGDSIVTPKRAVIDAVNDMKAAVRFFYKDFATENVYKVDTANVVVGGYSAGAITSLHFAYANTFEDVQFMGGQDLLLYVNNNGGFEGNSGNPGYPFRIKAVVNLAGSLFSSKLVSKGEPALYSVHGTDDYTVPYKKGNPGETAVETEGSKLIHKRANKVKVKNLLRTIPGANHAAFFNCHDCLDEMRSFLFEIISG